MSNVNNQFKELINEAVDNYYHNNIEMKIILKDWLHGICEQLDECEAKAKAFDLIVAEDKSNFSCGDFCDDVRHIINSYESGEYDAKK